MDNLNRYKTPVAARLVGVSANTLKLYAKKDPDFPQPVRIGSRIILWDVKAIRAYLAN